MRGFTRTRHRRRKRVVDTHGGRRSATLARELSSGKNGGWKAGVCVYSVGVEKKKMAEKAQG